MMKQGGEHACYFELRHESQGLGLWALSRVWNDFSVSDFHLKFLLLFLISMSYGCSVPILDNTLVEDIFFKRK